jgi:excisionase family DNA binding protein
MEEHMKEETQKPMLLKEAEASKILGVSYPYLKVLRRKGLIRYCKVGTAIRYRYIDLQKFVQNSLVEAETA